MTAVLVAAIVVVVCVALAVVTAWPAPGGRPSAWYPGGRSGIEVMREALAPTKGSAMATGIMWIDVVILLVALAALVAHAMGKAPEWPAVLLVWLELALKTFR